MARVPSSGATMVSAVSSVEDWDPHNLKSDGAVVRLVAVVSALDSVQGRLDAGEIFEQSRVDGTDSYGRSDLATVFMTALPSGLDGLVFTDEAVVPLTAVPSATEFHSVIYTDAATAALTAEVSGADAAAFSDSESALLVARIYSLNEEATVTMVSREVEHDDTQQMVESAIVSMTAVPSTTWEVHVNVDQGTASLTGVPSGIDGKVYSDAAVVSLTGVPSGTDIKARGYTDSSTVATTGTPSGVELYAHIYTDSGTVTLTGVPSGVDVLSRLIDMKFFGANGDAAAGDTHSLTASLNGGAATAGEILVVTTVGLLADLPVLTDNISGTTGWVKLGDSLAIMAGFRTTKWWKLCVGAETSVTVDWPTSGHGRAFEALICRSLGALNEAYLISESFAQAHFSDMEYGVGDGHGTSFFPSGNGQIYIGCTAIGPSTYSFAALDGGVTTHDNNGVGGNGQNVGGTSVGYGCIMHINDNAPANLVTDQLLYGSRPLIETFDSFIGIR